MVKAVKQRASSEHAKTVKLKDNKLSMNIPEDWGATQGGVPDECDVLTWTAVREKTETSLPFLTRSAQSPLQFFVLASLPGTLAPGD